MATSNKADLVLMSEVWEYFAKEPHLAPSQIDVAMGIPSGTAHKLIIRKWANEKAGLTGNTGGVSYEQF